MITKFGFQTAHLIKHSIKQLASQILDFFNADKFTVGIELRKAFDAVDLTILLK